MFVPEGSFVGVQYTVCGEETFDARHTLVRVEGVESWEVPSLCEVGVFQQFVTCFSPDIKGTFSVWVIWIGGGPCFKYCMGVLIFFDVLILDGEYGLARRDFCHGGGESNIAIGVLFGDGGGGCCFSDELCVFPGCVGVCCPQ